jgi:hypothetical protein
VSQQAGRIYVYSAPGYDTTWTRTSGSVTTTGQGRFKVGWTGRADARVRVREQTGTVYPDGDGIVIHLDEPAVRDDGTPFTDTDVLHVLDSAGVHRTSEVVEATLDEIRAAVAAVRTGHRFDPDRTEGFKPRDEQLEAIERTAAYFTEHADDAKPPRFLWNAKMRFGKTFTTYQLAKRMGWRRVLVLTYKPAVRDSWRDDLLHHVDFAGWVFADRDNPVDLATADAPVVWFASFQDLLGTTADGQVKDHNQDLHTRTWDCVVVDEYHFGAWQGAAREVCEPVTVSTDDEAGAADHATEVAELADAGLPRLIAAAPDTGTRRDLTVADLRITGRCFLYLSGTPFRALAEGEFNEDAIFNWTYPDEQRAKAAWDADPTKDPAANPYLELPQMQLYTYSLGALTGEQLQEHSDDTFDLSRFFAARKDGPEYHFVDPVRVNEFLDVLRGRLKRSATDKLLSASPPFPYSHPDFAAAVQHTVWFLPTVAACHAMKAALASHPHFKDHLVHVAAGTAAKTGAEAKPPVDAMLAKAAVTGQPTITLSCGKLMTGVTVPQWGAILILRSLKAPESYFQAAFRVQSPWRTRRGDGTVGVLKPTCYVFDFDPTRALTLIYQYGTRLAGADLQTSPADAVRELTECLPIFHFDGGRMDPVDVEHIMDWGTIGIGATMLARRWGSARLINLTEDVLTRLLGDPVLVARLEQMEDFRNIRDEAQAIIAKSQQLKAAKAASSGESTGTEDPEVVAARKARRKQVETLRKKLQKLIQRIPVFMYLTDKREESLVDVIRALDTQLFERVTGLTLGDFNALLDLGVFHAGHMDAAVWQFRQFERASLRYLDEPGRHAPATGRVGLFTTTVPAEAFDRTDGHMAPGLLSALLRADVLEPGAQLVGAHASATLTPDGRLLVNGEVFDDPDTAARAVAGITDVTGAGYWSVPGWGTLGELAELLAEDAEEAV